MTEAGMGDSIAFLTIQLRSIPNAERSEVGAKTLATRIVHLSDLHFPAASLDQVTALEETVRELSPTAVVVTGDLTRRGRRAEFEAAARFIRSLPGAKLVVPGNHDVPLVELGRRALLFKRFGAYFPSDQAVITTTDVLLVGLNTAAGMRFSMDWSLGLAQSPAVVSVCDVLRKERKYRLGIVACHHPLTRTETDLRRSRTKGGDWAASQLADAGMTILLHGHLHRPLVRRLHAGGHEIVELGANTALSDRERAGPAGFNVIDIVDWHWTATHRLWIDRKYREADQS
jgi:3',5'-cyclic AMP phosphodiesterase CpdA